MVRTKERVIVFAILALFLLGIVLPVVEAQTTSTSTPTRIDFKAIGKNIFDWASTALGWYKVERFEVDPETGEYTKPIYNEGFKAQRQVVNGILFFFFFFSLIFWSSGKIITQKGARIGVAGSLGALLSLAIVSVFGLELLYPFIYHIFFLIVFLVLFMILATENLLGKHKVWAFFIALALAWLAFNSLNILSQAPGVTPNATVVPPPPGGGVSPPPPGTFAVTGSGSVRVGNTISLSLANQPTGTTASWSSGDTSKATVDASGRVTGVAAGSVTITATAGTATARKTITVTARAAPPSADARGYFNNAVRALLNPSDPNRKNNALAQYRSFQANARGDPTYATVDAAFRRMLTGAGVTLPPP